MAMRSLQPQCVAYTGDWCGEGPVWRDADQCLYWTDINRFLIHRLDPSGAVRTWAFEEPVTALALTERPDTLAVALGSRVVFWNPATGEHRDQGFRLPGWPHVRLNDGRPDPRGSLWVGSMRNNVNPDGSSTDCGGADGVLFRIDPDGTVREFKQGIGVSNTFAWSPDHTRFYFADSLANVIWVYGYDFVTGEISGERPFFTGYERGAPDGSAIDSEGFLWNSRYGGSCVVRIDPDGKIDRVVELPTPNITSCTFGGPDLKTLYITSAASGTKPGDRVSGCLFAVNTGVCGLPEHKFL